ncbi:hypothetical protein Nepgr_001083 [Nepenthes gracilis]|uniref:Uncharacterized protein n=1 Tax=Nepenthes gracilis TaxID=150966 RepID=A0AAD3P7L8_NEPGR|nr:hypothetical protein Nepgr_001083 [Nepenthes gracilis]
MNASSVCFPRCKRMFNDEHVQWKPQVDLNRLVRLLKREANSWRRRAVALVRLQGFSTARIQLMPIDG